MFIDEESLGLLTDQDKEEFAIWEELLSSRGFALLKEFLEVRAESANSVIENAVSWEHYQYNRGGRDALALVLNLETTLEQKVQSMVDERREVIAEQEDSVSDIEINLGLLD